MSSQSSLAVRCSAGTVAVGAVVAVIALLIWGVGSAPAILAGITVAVAIQIAVFWAFFVFILPDRPGLAYSIGAVVRLVSVGLMAFVGVTALGLAPAPTLLSMVGCLFGSTLLEALFLQRRVVARVGPGVPTMR